jgi:imidazolonepropionase-like amidohydrolase
VNLGLLEGMPLTLLTTKAVVAAREMLLRGFTTVRDAGGGDHGIKTAIESGIIDGPRLFIAGMPISQTGGHADFRRRNQTAVECSCCSEPAVSRRRDRGRGRAGVELAFVRDGACLFGRRDPPCRRFGNLM